MLWTADPLVARNAHFNINRLGAMPVEYVENIYGANTGSTLHGSLPTDRTVIAWQLSRVHAPHANAGRAEPGDGGVPLANPLDHDGLPRFDDPGAAEAVRVQVPVDLVAVQRAGGDDAMRWRLSVRESFNACLAAGLTVTRFVRPTPHTLPYYVFGRP
jgi:predicted GNAT superfamily acetyltransferase